jgi:hypothetical protein
VVPYTCWLARVAVAPLPNAAELANFADEQLPPWKDRTHNRPLLD